MGDRLGRRAGGGALRKSESQEVVGVVVLGVDPSLTCTGWALIGGERDLVACGQWRHADGGEVARRDAYCDDLGALLRERWPGLVVVETQYVSGGRGNSILRLTALRGALVREARAAGVEVVEVQPACAKEALTGTGSATKERMVLYAQERFGIALRKGEHDKADAMGLALAGLHLLGLPTQEAMVL